MIRLTKRPEPEILANHGTHWTDVVRQKIASGIKPTPAEGTRYRHPEIKEILVEETNGKCAYCESKLKHIHHGDVEHIYPKSLDPLKTFEWNNLTLACEVCNQNKSNRDPLIEHILDPYHDDPEQHLVFLGSLIFFRGTAKGTASRAILDLHRSELTEMRQYQVEKIMLVYNQVLDPTLPTPVRKAIYDDLVSREGSPKAPYTAMAKSIIQNMEACIDPALIRRP